MLGAAHGSLVGPLVQDVAAVSPDVLEDDVGQAARTAGVAVGVALGTGVGGAITGTPAVVA